VVTVLGLAALSPSQIYDHIPNSYYTSKGFPSSTAGNRSALQSSKRQKRPRVQQEIEMPSSAEGDGYISSAERDRNTLQYNRRQ
jgi:hypothetical protein